MVANPASYAGKPVPPPGRQRGRAVPRLERREPDRPRAGHLRRPRVRRRPRLHRHGRARRLLASGSRPPPRAPRRSPSCSPSPRPCRPAPDGERGHRAPCRRGVRRAGVRRPLARRRAAGGRRRPSASVTPSPTSAQRPDAAGGAVVRRAPRRRARPRAAGPAPRGGALPRRAASGLRRRPRSACRRTTATSLTSLGTALTPGHHGVLGYTTRIPGTDRLLNALQWSKDVDPTAVAAAPDRVRAAGRGRGGHHHGQQARVRRVRAHPRQQPRARSSSAPTGSASGSSPRSRAAPPRPSLTYLYDPDLDWTGHRYGVDSEQWRAELAAIDASAEQLREMLRPETRLARASPTTAWSTRRRRAAIEVDDEPGLRDGVALVGGEARFRHLYCRGGAVDDVLATWRAVLGDRAEVLSRDEAFARGWFGQATPLARPARRRRGGRLHRRPRDPARRPTSRSSRA